jgi:hypothetical protein
MQHEICVNRTSCTAHKHLDGALGAKVGFHDLQ